MARSSPGKLDKLGPIFLRSALKSKISRLRRAFAGQLAYVPRAYARGRSRANSGGCLWPVLSLKPFWRPCSRRIFARLNRKEGRKENRKERWKIQALRETRI